MPNKNDIHLFPLYIVSLKQLFQQHISHVYNYSRYSKSKQEQILPSSILHKDFVNKFECHTPINIITLQPHNIYDKSLLQQFHCPTPNPQYVADLLWLHCVASLIAI